MSLNEVVQLMSITAASVVCKARDFLPLLCVRVTVCLQRSDKGEQPVRMQMEFLYPAAQ